MLVRDTGRSCHWTGVATVGCLEPQVTQWRYKLEADTAVDDCFSRGLGHLRCQSISAFLLCKGSQWMLNASARQLPLEFLTSRNPTAQLEDTDSDNSVWT